MGRKAYKSEPSFLETNTEYLMHYNNFLKNARIWNNSGQYWLGKEYSMRADCLLRGDYEGGMAPIRTEMLYYNKMTRNIGNVNIPLNN
tara:strand:- start:4 stop:267 length:264 start_codon:yes stop_codon:yes gene_type:complete